LADFYSTLTIPSLRLIGKEDMIVTLAHSFYFASLNKNGDTIVYEEVGHALQWENERFNKDLANFVSGI
jgi:pimeloyl-ACP methyl ester carboxylesterase